MNCDKVESLLADAIGGELPEADRSAFENHLAGCARCREEYNTLCAALSEARSLPSAGAIHVERLGDRLVLGPASVATFRPDRSWTRAALRYAASVLIAFAAGYSAHSSLVSRGGATPGGAPTATTEDRQTPAAHGAKPLQLAFADAHIRNPGKSDLAKGMIAVFDAGR